METRAKRSSDLVGSQLESMIGGALEEVAKLAVWMRTSPDFARFVSEASRFLVQTYRSCGKVLACGNGGSAADAQHLVGELVGKYRFDRPPLDARALSTDTSILTAIGNDYGFDMVFARQIIACGNSGDVLIVLSTSGASRNILAATEVANERGLKVIGFTGIRGESLSRSCSTCLVVPSSLTPRIQEVHQVAYHLVCHVVEEVLFGTSSDLPR